MTVAGDNKTALVNWFVNDTRAQFEDYNSIMETMVSKKVVGDDATTNFATSRLKSTMMAVEATAVVAFLTIQSTFMAVARPLTKVLQLDFQGAFNTFKDNIIVTALALKISLSMLPLIFVGVISPSTAYAKIAGELNDIFESRKTATLATAQELADIKEKLAAHLNMTKEEVNKLTAEELAGKVEGLITAHTTQLRAIATAAGMAVDADLSGLTAFVTALKATTPEDATNLLAVDKALCEALGEAETSLQHDVRMTKIATLTTSHGELTQAQTQLAEADVTLAAAADATKALLAKLESTAAELDALKVKSAAFEETAGKLPGKVEELAAATAQIATLKGEVEAKAALVLAKEATITELTAAAKPGEGDAPAADEQLQNAIADLSIAREALATAESEHAAKILEVNQAKDVAVAEKEALRADVAALLVDANAELAILKPAKDTADKEVRDLTGRVQLMEVEHKKELANANAIIATRVGEIADLEERKALVDAKVLELEAKLAPPADGAITPAAKVAALTEQLAAARGELAILGSQIAEKDAEIADLKVNVNKYHRSVQEITGQRDSLAPILNAFIEGQLNDLQFMAHRLGYQRCLHLPLLQFSADTPMDEELGTKATWGFLKDSMVQYQDSITAMYDGAPDFSGLYNDPAKSVADGRLNPMPTGIFEVNTNMQGESWAKGANQIILNGLIKKGQEGSGDSLLVFVNADGEIVMPITSSEEHKVAAQQAYGHQPYLTDDMLGKSKLNPAFDLKKPDDTNWQTDTCWLSTASRVVSITDDAEAALRIYAESLGLRLKSLKKDQVVDMGATGIFGETEMQTLSYYNGALTVPVLAEEPPATDPTAGDGQPPKDGAVVGTAVTE